jgi:hypothetical protein
MAQKTYRVMGDLVKTDMTILNEVFSATDMRIRLKNYEDLFVTNETVDLHVYVSTGHVSGNYNYLIGGTIEGEFETVEKVLKEIASLLESRNIVYNFEFYEDCDGEPPEEHCIKHPDF